VRERECVQESGLAAIAAAVRAPKGVE